MNLNVPYEKQQLDYTCGPRSLSMVLSYFNQTIPLETLIALAGTTEQLGTSRQGMIRAFRVLNMFPKFKCNGTIEDLRESLAAQSPPIVNHRDEHEDFGHFSVVVKITKTHITLHDPLHGQDLRYPHAEFVRRWYGRHKTQFTRWYLTAHPR
ncbi:C39 family peptidase [Candidatus Uhrbacteria bacterium]|nr:C39 family peptidase [Candidatus Uhrbacteria bacterium]